LNKLFSNSLLIKGIIEDIDINKIKSFNYLYRNIDDQDLFQSVKEKGLLQPIIVRPVDDYFEIVAGNRRYNTCKKLGWKKIIAHIVEVDDKESFEISLIENIQRKNLNPIEEAHLFKDFVITYGWGGISELSSKIGKSVSYIDKRIKLLQLPQDIIDSVSLSNISPSTAEELITLDDSEKQSNLANLILERKLSSRITRNMVKDIKNEHYSDFSYSYMPSIVDIDHKTQKVFDKSITILKVATQKLGLLIDEVEENWIIYGLLMQHKLTIDNAIDLLIKQKKKL
jgi:ParB family chromosome partitioning protein